MTTFLHYAPLAICVLSIIAIALAIGADMPAHARARVIGVLVITLLIAALYIR